MNRDDATSEATDTTADASSAAGEPTTLRPDQRFGSSRLIRPIGKGGMGEVWLARHEMLGRNVAIKFLRTAVMDRDDPAYRTFVEGAKVAASLEHPGLNKVHHADVADGVPYLVLEFLDGSSLQELVELSGRLEIAAVRTIIEAVCEAVAALHHRDLLHRDIKPSNIMLTADGRVVLTDFGLACAGPVSALRSNSGGVSGTPAYMAPEMFDGIVSARTDVYAIGMTAYYLLCGKPAFSGSLDKLQQQHKTAPLDIEPLRAAGVGDEVIDVIVRATSKDLLFRPKTARHLLDAFRTTFDAAKIQPASREALAQLVHGQLPGTTDQRRADARTGAGTAGKIAEFADRKRGLRELAAQCDPAPLEPLPEVTPADKNEGGSERRKVWIACLVASAVGTVVGLVSLGIVTIVAALLLGLATTSPTPVQPSMTITTQAPSIKPAESPATPASSQPAPQTAAVSPFPAAPAPPRGTSPTIPGRASPSNARLPSSRVMASIFGLAMLIAMVACWLIAVGLATLIYRLLRGKLLPKKGENTRCGWCQYELRGITTPVCSECGHRIGDQGPDGQREVPPSRRRARRIRTWVLLPLWVLAVYVPTTLMTTAVLMLVGYYLKRSGATSIAIGLGMSFVFPLLGLFGGMIAAMRYYESTLQFNVRYSGRAWCRVCRCELRDLAKPICPTCGSCI